MRQEAASTRQKLQPRPAEGTEKQRVLKKQFGKKEGGTNKAKMISLESGELKKE